MHPSSVPAAAEGSAKSSDLLFWTGGGNRDSSELCVCFFICLKNICESKLLADGLFSGSCCKQSSTKLWKAGENVLEKGIFSLSLVIVRVILSPIPESTPDREFFILDSPWGNVFISQGQYAGPFSFCSSIWVQGISWNGTRPLANSHAVIPTL